MMKSAGYENIEFEQVDAQVLVGRTVQDAIDFQLALGPAGEVFREAGDEAEGKRDEIEAALAEAIDREKKETDGIVMDSSSWVIFGNKPRLVARCRQLKRKPHLQRTGPSPILRCGLVTTCDCGRRTAGRACAGAF